MRRRLSLLIAVMLVWPALAQPAAGTDRSASVSLIRHSDGDSGTLAVELLPEDSWAGDVFISLYRDDFRERKGIRPSDDGSYRLDVRLPNAGTWGIYLRYGIAQSGYAGYGTLVVPASGGNPATAIVDLSSGFEGEVPGFVQPLGFGVFAVIAILTVVGLRALLLVIRRRQVAGVPT